MKTAKLGPKLNQQQSMRIKYKKSRFEKLKVKFVSSDDGSSLTEEDNKSKGKDVKV